MVAPDAASAAPDLAGPTAVIGWWDQRWHGRRPTERFLRRIHEATKDEDPGSLATYVNFPSTEYLDLSFADFLSFAKANKDKLTYANAGLGSASYLCGILFMSAINTNFTMVPYKGTGPAMNDLVGGQVDFMCDQTTNTVPQIKSGNVKAYGVTTRTRLPSMADLPTNDVLRGTLDLLVLKTLALGPMHGWGISQRIEQLSRGVLGVNQGSLYPALHRLERRGWIRAEWGSSDNNRKAKFYQLTPSGKKQLAADTKAWARLTNAVGLVLDMS